MDNSLLGNLSNRTQEESHRNYLADIGLANQSSMGAVSGYGQAGALQSQSLNDLLGVGRQVGIDPAMGINVAGADIGNALGLEQAKLISDATKQSGKVVAGTNALQMFLDMQRNQQQQKWNQPGLPNY